MKIKHIVFPLFTNERHQNVHQVGCKLTFANRNNKSRLCLLFEPGKCCLKHAQTVVEPGGGYLTRTEDSFHLASRFWDKDRDGFIMGEGVGVLVIEYSLYPVFEC